MEFHRGLLNYGSKMKTWDTALWAYSQATLTQSITVKFVWWFDALCYIKP